MGERLTIGLEDAGAGHWWQRVLFILGSQNGWGQKCFIARDDAGRELYRSGTFAAPPLAGDPREDWSPGMDASLASLRAEIAEAGWHEDGRGSRPWEFRYARGDSGR